MRMAQTPDLTLAQQARVIGAEIQRHPKKAVVAVLATGHPLEGSTR